jgi:IclR family pca regulon transcriptional regulator
MPRLTRSAEELARLERYGPTYVEALARGLKVLQALGADRRPLTLSEIATGVGLARASVRRTLHTLSHLGFAEADGRSFRLTPKVLTLAGAYLTSDPAVDILQPAVERLAQETGEASSASVLDGPDVVMIAHASPRRVIAVSAQIGYRLPALASSLGRALLAGLDDAALSAFLARHRPIRHTRYTVVDRRKLHAAILKARRDGFAVVDQEAELGFRSVSVPLRRRDGRTIAALNIGAHSERVPLKELQDRFLPALRRAAEQLQPHLL